MAESEPEIASIEAALVAVGGSGERLREGGVEFSLSKSFIQLNGQPLLYWCMRSLQSAGVRRVVLTADSDEKLDKAWTVTRSLHPYFHEIFCLRNSAPGSTGLPFHARDLFEGAFLFECGHAVLPADHYRELAARWYRARGRFDLLLTGYTPTRYSRRHYVRSNTTLYAVGEPLIASPDYCTSLPEFSFSPGVIFPRLVSIGKAGIVPISHPIEPDVVGELQPALASYRMIAQSHITSEDQMLHAWH